jgi:phytoene dehydrogenase-like protein
MALLIQELRAHSLRMIGSAGIYPDDVAPLAVMMFNVPMQVLGFGGGVYEGGTHNLTHALQRALSEEGGKFFVGADVDEILVKNGRACGIKLADGTEIEAKKMVITSIVITQTLDQRILVQWNFSSAQLFCVLTLLYKLYVPPCAWVAS